ncbi:type VI secretion system-associated protein TagF [Stenotrophomonas sp. ATCM1_4]|uniref:Type VI secretion system-associated protein TagF n=1 Tax=Stenotrophomonas capsici TaxID=3110230 RepID=A0ABU5V8W0_9GAMM|nr:MULTISPECIES: type VI secretion system-associated protein TagF [unclassified Stenotrophomonas]MEA5669422.1 type VI secretion system-associated protein TagF [Stenotrophomonas sp. MH1]TDB26206.1 type VI secretion system-associated protein TagF [Stenotrophomonas sp. ATCM1_4]
MSRAVNAGVSYFGKVPSRGDFVRTADNHQLLGWLDRWAGESLELLSQSPDWKQRYDAAPDIHYAFLGSRSKTVLCGHLLASRDASERRFPLLSVVRLDATDPLPFIGRSPLAMSNAWSGLARLARQAYQDDDATEALSRLGEARFSISTEVGDYNGSFQDFLEGCTVGELEQRLREAGHGDVSLKHMLPAMGMLLQPVLSGGDVNIDKALVLPLARDAVYRPLIAAFWLDMISSFVSRGDFELSVLVRNDATPTMVVGFNGADRQVLRAVLDPSDDSGFLIHLKHAEWVEEYLGSDYNLNRLGSFLDRDDLALATARKLFGETFLGT